MKYHNTGRLAISIYTDNPDKSILNSVRSGSTLLSQTAVWSFIFSFSPTNERICLRYRTNVRLRYQCSIKKHAYIILIPLNPTFIWYNWDFQGFTFFSYFLICARKLYLPPKNEKFSDKNYDIFFIFLLEATITELWSVLKFCCIVSVLTSRDGIFLPVTLWSWWHFVLFKAIGVCMCPHRLA